MLQHDSVLQFTEFLRNTPRLTMMQVRDGRVTWSRLRQ